MCQYGGSLDYVVALHNNSNEIRILRLTGLNTALATVLDYKVVDKDVNLTLVGNLYVDCYMTGMYLDANTYTIGIIGSFFTDKALSSYYFAKFSTKYNLTEYFIKSDS